MFLCLYSARHCQIVATMSFVRRFWTSSEFSYRHTSRHISKGLGCYPRGRPSNKTHSALTSPTATTSNQRCDQGQHVYFSKFRSSETTQEAEACSRVSGASPSSDGVETARRRRWHSLHWDRRETSLMCLKDSTGCGSAFSRQREEGSATNSNSDCKDAESPVLFSIERGTVNHVLSALSSMLLVQDGLKDVTATLHRLSAAMHLQSVLETAAKPWDGNHSDDIIIRNNRPLPAHPNRDDIMSSHPVRHTGPDFVELPVKRSDRGQSSKFPASFGKTEEVHKCPEADIARRRHLYFNKVYHVPMVADVPEPSHVHTSTDDVHPPADSGGMPEQSGPECPKGDSSMKPSKEQILLMYERLALEMPNFLHASHDFTMYANTVEFDNRIMKFKTRGLPAYKASVQGLKHLCTAYMTGSTMEVLRITAELDLGQIHARWRVKGVPLHSYIIRPWRRKHPDRYFDALSTFELGTDGLIHRHVMDKVMPTPSDKVRAPSVATRIGIALGLVRNPALSPNCMVPKPLSFMQAAKTSTGKL